MPEECRDYEVLQWQPNRVEDTDLFVYLQASRSIAAFAGMCDGAEPDQAAAADETTMSALDTLHKFDYDTSRSLQALVKCPAKKSLEKKWGEDDSKLFVKGLKQYGKNFYQIKKTLLPRRQTGELIEYYYYWKKTQNAVSNRHQVKKLKKSKKTTRSSQPDVEFLDHSSVSECSEDSEDSDAGRDLKDYTCQRCFTNESKDWHHAGKDRGLLCTPCRMFFKKYGEDRPLDAGDKDGSQYLFKPVKEEDDTLNGKHNMRTRRGNSTGETKGKKSERSNSTSSPDIEAVGSKLGPNSPSVASTGSSSSNDKDAKDNNNIAQNKTDAKAKKRRSRDLEEGKVKKSRSDSESMIDSSEASGNEDLGNEADSDDNNQDDLSASSQPSTPSSLDTEFKSTKDYIKPEPLPQSPLVGLPHPHPRPPLPSPASTTTIITTTTTTTTTTACSVAPVVTPVPVTQDSNPVGFGVGGRYPLPLSGANAPMLPVGATFGDIKPPLGLYPHPHPLAGTLAALPPRHAPETTSTMPVVSSSSEPGVVSNSSLPPPQPHGNLSSGGHAGHSVSSLLPHSSANTFSTSVLSSTSTAAPSTVFPSSAPSSTLPPVSTSSSSSSMMTSMSSTGVTLMSSGAGSSSGDGGEREKKYTPPVSSVQPQQQPIPPPGMGGSLFTPYNFFPYGAHLGPRLAGPPPPVPSLVPIKKEPGGGEPGRAEEAKDSPAESHTVHRPLPQTLPPASIQSSQASDQKLPPPPHMPVPPPLTSIESPMPGGLVDRAAMVGGPESLRDNSRETILREAREISLLAGAGNPGANIPPELAGRTLFPPPLTSLPPSATVTSSSMPHALAGNIPHHLPVAMSVPQGERSRPDTHHPSMEASRQESGSGMGVAPPSLRPPPPSIPRVEDGGIVEEVVDDSDSDREGSTTPGPNPTPCNKEVMRSKSAFFIKVLDRGERNSCSRCDLVFKPLPTSALARKREERARKAASSSSSSSSHPSSRDEKPRERRPETPPKSASVESQSASSSATPSQHGLYPERHTPRPSYALANPDTPALRQLSEYARPHAMGQDPQRAAYLGLPGPHHMDPLAGYRHLAMYPHGSRERLELELERDKRERDARERELRERELREMEIREKIKADIDLKPPGLERLLPPGANTLDPHWLEMQRRLAYPPGAGLPVLPPGAPGSAGANHLPGVYPPVSLAGDLAAREKLERLGVTGAHHPHLPVDLSYAGMVERLSAERQQVERLLVPPSNPEALARLQMASLAGNQAAAAAAAMHAHTHAHTHSHTHLHLHQQQENNLAAAAAALAGGSGGGGQGGPPPPPAPLHPLAHHLYPHLPLSGADPMAGLPSASGTPSSLHPASQPLLPGASSREQAELLQRELYSRAYMDPALAHQLTAQAAHHEAIQRQLAMERDRFGPGHLPH